VEKLLLTAEEAGELLSIGRTKVYELMADGLIESVAIGRCRRIPVRALEPFVEALRRGGSIEEHPAARMDARWSRAPPSGWASTPLNECAEQSPGSARRSRG